MKYMLDKLIIMSVNTTILKLKCSATSWFVKFWGCRETVDSPKTLCCSENCTLVSLSGIKNLCYQNVRHTGVSRAAEQPGAKSDATVPVDGVHAEVAGDDGRAEELASLLVVVHVTAELLHVDNTSTRGSVWRQDIRTAPFRQNSPLKRSEWHVLTRDRTVSSATNTFIHEWNEPSCLYSAAAAHHRIWAELISRPTEGRRLSWPGWLVTYRGGMPARRRSPIPVPTDRQYGGWDRTHFGHVLPRKYLGLVLKN